LSSQSVHRLRRKPRNAIDRFERVLDGERFTDLEASLERADGTMIETSVSVAPLRDSAGEIHGCVAVVADITDRKEREQKLQRKNEQLQEFTSVLSHDLRTPLSVASGNLELVAEGEHDRIDTVAEALDRMDALIDDVLALARTGWQVEDTAPVELSVVAREAWEHVATGSATLAVADGTPTVESDRRRLLELFENLFRNSIEHAGEDITVRVDPLEPADVLPYGPGSDAMRGFYVEDDGPGIPPEERDRVFESGYTTRDRGTGFGLAIVDGIADAHGWSVRIEEGADGGARFEFVTGANGRGDS